MYFRFQKITRVFSSFFFFVFLVAVLSFISEAQKAMALQVLTEDAPPLNYVKDGKPAGVAVELVMEIQKRINSIETIGVVPWARGYKMALEETDVALFSTTRTPEREDLFYWVGPLATKNWVFMKMKDNKSLVIKSLDDAKKVKAIGTYKDDAKDQFLKKQDFKNLESIVSDDQNAEKLEKGRIDLWITGQDDCVSYVKKAGLDIAKFEVAYEVQKKELYVVFSKKTDLNIVKKWQTAYDAMVQDGTYAKIHSKYK
ncbi:MAG: transporter substrate-binding domain-containing protein [Oligoflexia bacterium]|nr:transporter substrate-binding domain-containing protein [Oligoflexia bacterium]